MPIPHHDGVAVLLCASQSKASKEQIIQHAKGKLLNILVLKQPNNHGIAYELLKKISNKDFGENNSNAWKKWAARCLVQPTTLILAGTKDA